MNRGLKRLYPALAALLPALMLACGGGSGSTSGASAKLSVLMYQGSIVSLPVEVAVNKGFFAKHNLDVTLQSVASSTIAVSGLLSGSADVMLNSTEITMQTREKGQDIVMVAGNMVTLPWILLVNTDYPTAGQSFPANAKSLVGKKIGVTGVGTSSEFFARALLATAGIKPDQVTMVGVGFAATGLPALYNHSVDAYLATDPAATLAVDVQHKAQILVDTRKGEGNPLFKQWDYNGFEAQHADVTRNPDVYKRFNAAMADAQNWMHDSANLSELVAYASQEMNVDQPTAQLLMQNNLATFGNTLSRQAIENTSTFMVNTQQLSKPAKYEDVVYFH